MIIAGQNTMSVFNALSKNKPDLDFKKCPQCHNQKKSYYENYCNVCGYSKGRPKNLKKKKAKPQMMICENAKKCRLNCPTHKKKHIKIIQCDRFCMRTVVDGKCIPVKKKKRVK